MKPDIFKTNPDYKAFANKVVAMLVAGTLVLFACDNPGEKDDPNGGNGNGNGGEKKPVLLTTANSRLAEDLKNYVEVTIPRLGFSTETQVMDAAKKYADRKTYVGRNDTVMNKKVYMNVATSKSGNPNTFDSAQAFIDVANGDCTDRKSSIAITSPYNPQHRGFVYEYATECNEKE